MIWNLAKRQQPRKTSFLKKRRSPPSRLKRNEKTMMREGAKGQDEKRGTSGGAQPSKRVAPWSES